MLPFLGFFLKKGLNFHTAHTIFVMCDEADVFGVIHVCLHLHVTLPDKKLGLFSFSQRFYLSLGSYRRKLQTFTNVAIVALMFA